MTFFCIVELISETFFPTRTHWLLYGPINWDPYKLLWLGKEVLLLDSSFNVSPYPLWKIVHRNDCTCVKFMHITWHRQAPVISHFSFWSPLTDTPLIIPARSCKNLNQQIFLFLVFKKLNSWIRLDFFSFFSEIFLPILVFDFFRF